LGFASAAQPSIIGGHDFAFGGARMALDGPGLAPSVTAQAGMLLGTVGALPAGALYVVEGGGNDARDALEAAAVSSDPFGVIGAAAAAYAQATGAIVDQLQAAGARRIVVWNVPNLGTTPAVAAQGSGAAFLGGQVSLAMNGALAGRLAGEAGVSLFDAYGVLGAVIADPGAFGLLNVADACGAVVGCDPSTFLFWDGIHPTSAGHAILAQQLLASAVPEPGVWVLMACGLLILARRRLGRRAVPRESDSRFGLPFASDAA
jgi:outer membrane lipase/esterase